MQCWKVVLCAASVVTAFVRQGSDVLAGFDVNSSGNFNCLGGAQLAKVQKEYFDDPDKRIVNVLNEQQLQGCQCVVACGGATHPEPDGSWIQHKYVCLSSMCEAMGASTDGWAHVDAGATRKLFWSKNSWMTAPQAQAFDTFPVQTSKADKWYKDSFKKSDSGIDRIDSMISFMKVVADKLASHKVSLYLDFCDVNPICHGLGQAKAQQWIPNRKHQKIVMSDLASGLTQATHFLPNHNSNGPYCGAEYAKAKMLAQSGQLKVMDQLPEEAKLVYATAPAPGQTPPVRFAGTTYVDPIIKNPSEMDALVNNLIQNMDKASTESAESGVAKIVQNFDTSVAVPDQSRAGAGPVVVPGNKILAWATKVLEECEGGCSDDATDVP